MPKSERLSQTYVPGVGEPYSSPRKRAPRNVQRVEVLGQDKKIRKLQEQLKLLMSGETLFDVEGDTGVVPALSEALKDDADAVGADMWVDDEDVDPFQTRSTPPPPPQKSQAEQHPAGPSLPAIDQYHAWLTLLHTLITPLLTYEQTSLSKPIVQASEIPHNCCHPSEHCNRKSSKILCLFHDHFKYLTVEGCRCQTIQQRLVLHGLFPAAPKQPRVAISIDLLNFYHTLFEESCDAVYAMSHALKKYYLRRGYILTNMNGSEVKEPFRRSLSAALQWHDNLRVLVSRRVDNCISAYLAPALPNKVPPNEAVALGSDAAEPPRLPPENETNAPPPPILDAAEPPRLPPENETNAPPPILHQCSRLLQSRCSACFGGATFGRSFLQGGDFHVAVDGNFHHRHRRSAGESPQFYTPDYFLSKSEVDIVGMRIEKARKKKSAPVKSVVPSEAIDECQRSHDAANENRSKSSAEQFDDHGCSALVCRHGAPLFAANIDTPGEQQKYAIALIKHLFSLIPSNANVVVLYDVGCVMKRSLELYPAMLPAGIINRLAFTTSAMHAYAHQWSCQIVYNPRLQTGMGLTDGEVVERLRSQSRGLIGIERASGRARRIWYIDRKFGTIGASRREDLGDWIARRSAFAKKELRQSKDVVRSGGISLEELSAEWESQRKAQLSSRAHTPLRLKQELDTILTLQSEVDTVSTTIEAARNALSTSTLSQSALTILPELVATSDKLRSQADAIYDSLSVSDRYPELKHCSFEFVRTLLVLHDLKIHIRRRAVGSFFEWDRLDQAVGGRHQPLGTKKHQRTRKAITKRKPALIKAIMKFNSLCEQLKSLYDPSWRIPLPEPLPTQLSVLRDAQSLLEDVWITPSNSSVPRWLENLVVRNGIRAMHKLKRCQEEQDRLLLERANMSRWLKAELQAVKEALSEPKNSPIALRLQLYQQTVNRLNERWSNALPNNPFSGTSEVNPLPRGCPQANTTTVISIELEAHLIEVESQSATEAEEELHSGEVLLSDILDQELESSDVLHPELESSTSPSIASQNDSDDNISHYTDPVRSPSPELFAGTQIIWALPETLRIDRTTLELDSLEPMRTSPSPPDTVARRVGSFTIDSEAIKILGRSTAWLDDVCINGCARMVQMLYSNTSLASHSPNASKCAIFSTHDLVLSRGSASDNVMWKNVADLLYWDKTTWIFPIHRPAPESHWVLCVAYPYQQQVHLMDSFGAKTSWTRDVEDLMQLITRLVTLANRFGHPCRLVTEGWTARPGFVQAVQRNGHDCGLWVLAGITAVLKGHHITGLRDVNMYSFRQALHKLVLTQPLHVRQRKNATQLSIIPG